MSPRKPRPVKERPPRPDADDTLWRIFLAVPLPPETIAAASALIDDLRPLGWPVRWVDPAGMHLTLHFLGEQPRERVELLRLGLPAVVESHTAFDLRTANLGCFPSIRHPRVLWLGLYGPVHRLETLQAGIATALAEWEWDLPREEFHPHITLGRVRNDDGPKVRVRDLPMAMKDRLADTANGVMAGPPTHPVPVTEVHLVRSHLSHEGARYEVLNRFPLRLDQDSPQEVVP
ncbi:MAG: RNA 2',3'-cyclic phosphodiesterase [Ilumatobacteraceae bacterium]